MSYRLKRDEPLPEGIKRITTEQIDRALKQLTEMPNGSEEAIHDARKRFKKIRAAVRLMRDEVGQDVYKQENVCYRNAGRHLSALRDSTVLVDTLDSVTEYFVDQLPPNIFAGVRQTLTEQHKATKQRLLNQESAVAEVKDTIYAAKKRVAGWPIKHNDFLAISNGLHRVYKRGQKRLAEAYTEQNPENFHEWRKRVKYLWYHTRILRPLWPTLQNELADELHKLSDYLGDDHDLAELRRTVLEQPAIFNSKQELQLLLALIDQQRTKLECQARPLGERIYAEKPRLFVKRMAGYWQVLQKETGSNLLA